MSAEPTLDLDHARTVAVQAARVAGKPLLDAILRAPGGIAAQRKGTHGDLVTDLDTSTERIITDRLRAAFPTHRILAEESGLIDAGTAAVADRPADSPTWLVDPVDGTNNIAIGLSAFAIGIGLCVAGRPVVGVVHEPATGRTWSAVRGGGALGPDGPLHYSPTAQDPVRSANGRRAVLAWTQGYAVDRDDPAMVRLRQGLERSAKRVLQLWAPLLCWVMLARGDIDGFVGYRAESIDLPAGLLIAEEAGVRVDALHGGAFDPGYEDSAATRSFVAAHADRLPALRATVADLVRVHETGR